MDEGAHALRSCLLLIVALMGARLEVAGVLMTDCIYSRPVKQISSEDDKVISHRQRCTRTGTMDARRRSQHAAAAP